MTKTQISINNYSFIWISSHFKICGKKKADQLAKSAIYEPLPPNFKYQPADFRIIVNEYVHDQGNIEWANEQINKLKNIIITYLRNIKILNYLDQIM